MSKYLIEDTTLIAIGDAIRSKTGNNETIKVANMASQIENISGGSGGLDEEDLTFTGSLKNLFTNENLNWLIEKYGNQFQFNGITDLTQMFYGNTFIDLSNLTIDAQSESNVPATNLFKSCYDLQYLPKLINFKPITTTEMFCENYDLREIPESFYKEWNYEGLDIAVNRHDKMFYHCRSLRHLPGFIKNFRPANTNMYSVFYNGFSYCYVLEEALDLPVNTENVFTANQFSSTFHQCSRLKRITFATNEDGTPKIAQWKSQTITLNGTPAAGVAGSATSIEGYNSGLTTLTKINDDTTYQALKDNPDNWTMLPAYSRYNKTSAIETINSLPDTSAYLATQSSGTNTIKFLGAAGSATDGGAINTMTEAEIAVATAKGWTVSFT